eukprot:jgi/Undpi1/4079/HiC_scaffold_16.g07446.m1
MVDFDQPLTNGVTLYLDTTVSPPRSDVYGASDGYEGYDCYGGYTGSLNPPRFLSGAGGGGGGGRGKDGGGPGGGDIIPRGRSGASDAPKTLIRRWLRNRFDRDDNAGGTGSGRFNPPADRYNSDDERRPLIATAPRSPPSRRSRPGGRGWGWGWDGGAGWDWCADWCGSGSPTSSGGEGGGGRAGGGRESMSWSSSVTKGGETPGETGANEVDGDRHNAEHQRRAILKMKRVNAHLANERTFLAWVRVTTKMFTAGVLSLTLAAEATASYRVVFVVMSSAYFALCPYVVFVGNRRFHKVADVMQGSVHDAYAFFTGRNMWGITVLLSGLAGLTLAAMATQIMYMF